MSLYLSKYDILVETRQYDFHFDFDYDFDSELSFSE